MRDTSRSTARGYASGAYARSLIHVGTPVHLPRAGGWLVRRPVGEARTRTDAEPIRCCRSRTHASWRATWTLWGPELVSITAVIDPLCGASHQDLSAAFPDHLELFKEHFVVDLERPVRESASKHHLRLHQARTRTPDR